MTDANGASTQVDLTAMRVADLQALASQMGIRGAARLRKGELVRAIEEARDAAAPEADEQAAAEQTAAGQEGDAQGVAAEQAGTEQTAGTAAGEPTAAPDSANSEPETTTEEAPTATDSVNAGETATGSKRGQRADKTPATEEAPKRGGRGSRRARAASGPAETAPEAGGEDPIAAAIFRDDATDATNAEAKRAGAKNAETPLSLDDLVLPPARGDDESEDEERGGRRRRRVSLVEGDATASDDGDQSDDNDDETGERQGSRRRGRGRRGRNNDGDRQQPSSDDGDDESTPDDQQSGRRGRGRGRQHAEQHDDEGDDRRGRGRYRDRKRGRGDDVDPEVSPDDVLLPIAGILDVLDNYAFVRTSGYLPGPNDVYVSLAQVKKYGLRKGDAIVGAVRQPREGEQQQGRQKFNAIVKFETINGQAPDEVQTRPVFDELTALYPQERLRLETGDGRLTQRMIDLFAPVGKGTRGLIVAPPKSGKSIVLQQIANAIAENSPQTHLMLVLVDERPEEVTSMRRTIRGEVVSSTFDLPAEDHTTIAELAIERAKRLVELGTDVVVLLDSITALSRAYNLNAPASGRILAGGVDASALYPPKRFFGAARNVENGGSLTVLATAMVETGSRTDEVILEEFAGKGNMELRLSREIADKRIFPAIDIPHSLTMHEEQLLTQDEVDATWAIRRELSHGDTQGALEAVLDRLSATATNEEFIRSVRKQPIAASGRSK
ncbi:transcription termination factor Rho [Pseudoclavibacter endophyticus]|uniref:Transcription termination factor Rho n=1 Tax=Pseudoclavibacter endophyticus TaxID=1778590 RepID=A0A6H9WL80_9MICO|nr:transcription termination factor Rho [Pseudoclavibacter endophyticus]KAB1649883.1 transcription termination factor Rho [Pseudoclavibacter endophyticus]GGA59016.1 transcription termination factor Rho [Pseudoclavibacter endophyticus]